MSKFGDKSRLNIGNRQPKKVANNVMTRRKDSSKFGDIEKPRRR